jgi:hypothetical protein
MSGENGNGQQIARKPDRTPLRQRDPLGLAEHFARSGYFKDTLSMSQAVVKIAAGEELGIGPMAAIQGITIIEGKLGMTANLMATLAQDSERFGYRVIETTNERCKLEFFERTDNGEKGLGVSEFELADAERAGLVKPRSNWEKWPKAMCFARALTQGVRTYCPSVTSGTSAYTVEELGAEVDEAGEIISVPNLDGDVPASEDAVDAVIELLDAGVVEGLVKGIEFLELDRNAINVILGSLGVFSLDDAFEDLADALARLKPDEAEKLSAEMQRMADVAGQEATSAS